MQRKTPEIYLTDSPCLIVAMHCAIRAVGSPKGHPELKDDGYATLRAANRYIRDNLEVKRYKAFKRGERPLLRDLHYSGRAIVCVLGHYLYLDRETYWSFFYNEDDEVVAMWELK